MRFVSDDVQEHPSSGASPRFLAHEDRSNETSFSTRPCGRRKRLLCWPAGGTVAADAELNNVLVDAKRVEAPFSTDLSQESGTLKG